MSVKCCSGDSVFGNYFELLLRPLVCALLTRATSSFIPLASTTLSVTYTMNLIVPNRFVHLHLRCAVPLLLSSAATPNVLDH